jgi:cobaltochelatase CobN
MEWLPGKAVALGDLLAGSRRRAAGVYPYVVDDPGEAAPAKRRLSASRSAICRRRWPRRKRPARPPCCAISSRFSQAQVLDPRRAGIVAGEIRARAEASGLAASRGVAADTEMNEALTPARRHLCDIAELPSATACMSSGSSEIDPASARNERENLLAALDGRFVAPGGRLAASRPAGRAADRTISTLDPRAIPTRRHPFGRSRRGPSRAICRTGDYPRRIVMDLWASPTLRSGSEDIALALMGVEPLGQCLDPRHRLLHPAAEARPSASRRDRAHLRHLPRHVSGADRASRPGGAPSRRWTSRTTGTSPPPPAAAASTAPIFGAAPGRYGAADGGPGARWRLARRDELGAAYLAAGPCLWRAGRAGLRRCRLRRQIRASDAFIHVSDTAGRDILEASSAADVIGGLAAAAKALGADPRSTASTPRGSAEGAHAGEDIARIVHGRLTHPRWIASQLAHGWRGAAELAEAVTLFVFAASTDAVADGLFDAVFQAYCADPQVWAALEAANAPAAASIRSRLQTRPGAALDQPAQLGRRLPRAGGGGMSALSQEALRRGWCPSTLRPMETGDGWLVRLHPPGATLTPKAAADRGAGGQAWQRLIEISARANLQIRGVTAESHPKLVERLLTEQLVDEHEGDGPQRVTLVSPLAGRDPTGFDRRRRTRRTDRAVRPHRRWPAGQARHRRGRWRRAGARWFRGYPAGWDGRHERNLVSR